MRKFSYALGTVIGVLVVGAGIAFAVVFYKGAGLNKEGAAYVDTAIVAIVAHWNKDELLGRASPRLIAATSPERLAALFDACAGALGPLVDYEAAKGQKVDMMFNINKVSTISAIYTARAKFQKGVAEFRVTLIKMDERWMIEGFHIDSPALMDSLVGRQS